MPDRPEQPLAVTMGDPAGIGLDITLQAIAGRPTQQLPPLVLYADPAAVVARARLLGIDVDVVVMDSPQSAAIAQGGNRLGIIPVPLRAAVVAGRPDPANGPAVIEAIEKATADVAADRATALVTNPVSKEVLYACGFSHPGHTEFLAELSTRHRPGPTPMPVMMLVADELRVVPATIHIPLKDVASRLSKELIVATVQIVVAGLRRYFGIARPRIAIAGLNPHAGEGGSIGREDVEIISPAVAALREEGLDVFGPLSADTMFHAAARARYDTAIAMYHDQALIPIKTLAFDSGVNVTLGLPFIRTSPDHGTAFDIAGTGRANPSSFIAALRLAERMAHYASREKAT